MSSLSDILMLNRSLPDAEMERLLLPDGFALPDGPAGPPAVTETVSNLGAGQAQDLIHAPHTLYMHRYTWTPTEMANTVPLLSSVKRFDLVGQLVNYLIVSPTASGQGVYLSLTGDIDWVLSGSNYYPSTEIQVLPGTGSQFIPIPARENWTIFAVGFSVPIVTNKDMLKLVYGYQPTGRDRLALE